MGDIVFHQSVKQPVVNRDMEWGKGHALDPVSLLVVCQPALGTGWWVSGLRASCPSAVICSDKSKDCHVCEMCPGSQEPRNHTVAIVAAYSSALGKVPPKEV